MSKSDDRTLQPEKAVGYISRVYSDIILSISFSTDQEFAFVPRDGIICIQDTRFNIDPALYKRANPTILSLVEKSYAFG